MSLFPCWEMLCPSPGHRQALDGWFLPGREGGIEGGMFCKLCVKAEGLLLIAPYLHISVSFALILWLTQ